MDHLPGCYLTTFNMSDRNNYNSNGQKQISIEVTRTFKQRYSLTDITVNRVVLGPQAASMCAGRDLYMLRQQTGMKLKQENQAGRRTLLVAGACVFLTLLTAAILGSVYLGYSLHLRGPTGKQQTYMADFYQDGHHIFKETLVITDRENMYATINGTVVNDYETGFQVYKMEHLPGCYLTSFNMSNRDDFSSNGQRQQVSIEVTQTSRQRYSVTDIAVNSAVLGPQAATMCTGRDLFMLRQQANSTNNGRLVKRATMRCFRICNFAGRCKIWCLIYED
ncbi:uncharacterized protein LOC128241198 [Mya arenaria]|uniref:uncharacterized protein LOC128241198 n=1 Tax=Mya arenaria TaxID=6604 RepID=UPI0022E58536|nr:uncharacterized protein LOC128241198 [Mya arenaria]